ncbi:MAG TPA: fused MFS/spermidine synthase [Myxococcales bacterium]|nr:fused MFS/spermidine synthase [Myxococcales bacterium]
MPRALYGIFVASGAAGLVYEVIWSRLFKEMFGVTAHAVATVLASYLLGLALGSWLLGPVADRRSDPLRLYALLEIGVGVSALATALVLPRLEPVHAWAAGRLAADSPALAAVRLVLAATVVVPPTLLMGATLPAMTRAVVKSVARVGRELSLLYALNTAGAVAGCALAGFALIGALGVHRTLWLAVVANVAAGAIALALRLEPSEPLRAGPAGNAGTSWVLGAMALSGIASLALEVIWTRVLILIVGTSTYAFVTMLTAFLAGIALGSALVRLLDGRIEDPRRAFGLVQLGIAIATLLSIPLLAGLVRWGQSWLLALEEQWLALFAARFGLACAVMLLPAVLMGMSFPLAGRIAVRQIDGLGRALGRVYGANTAGNIVGALLGGFLLIPVFGLQRSVALLAILNLGAAAWALLPAARGPARSMPLLAALLASVLLVVSWKPRPFSSMEEGDDDAVLYYREGLENTVKVIQRASDARQRIMLVDGVRIGQSSAGIDHKQQVLAHLPFLLHPRNPPRTVLSIGLGTGILMGEVTRHGIESGVCVELSPEVLEGARQFDAFNGRVLDDARVRVVVDDGINFLARSPERWDAIISDGKSRHGHVGNARFYSEDFYRSGRQHLTPGGVMVQWVPLDETPDELRTIARSFSRAFPHFYLWIAHNSVFMAGQAERLSVDLAAAQQVLDAPETADLRRHGWRSASELASLLILDGEAARAWLAQEDTVNSVERPTLEFYSPRAQAVPVRARIARNIESLLAARREPLLDVRFEGAPFELGARNDLLSGIASQEPLLLVKAALKAPPGIVRSWASSSLTDVALKKEAEGSRAEALALYRAAEAAWPDSVAAQVNLSAVLQGGGATLEAIQHAFLAVQLNPDSALARHLYGNLLASVGNHGEAVRQLHEAVRIGPNASAAHNDLAQQLALSGRHDEALAHFREAMRLRDDWTPPMSGAALVLATHPNPQVRDPIEAVRLARRAADLTSRQEPGTLGILASCYLAAGQREEAEATRKEAAQVAAASGGPARAAPAAELVRNPRRLDR